MIAQKIRMHGTFRGGMIVPDGLITLPEGSMVDIYFDSPPVQPDLRDELTSWDRASSIAWDHIDHLERGPS